MNFVVTEFKHALKSSGQAYTYRAKGEYCFTILENFRSVCAASATVDLDDKGLYNYVQNCTKSAYTFTCRSDEFRRLIMHTFGNTVGSSLCIPQSRPFHEDCWSLEHVLYNELSLKARQSLTDGLHPKHYSKSKLKQSLLAVHYSRRPLHSSTHLSLSSALCMSFIDHCKALAYSSLFQVRADLLCYGKDSTAIDDKVSCVKDILRLEYLIIYQNLSGV